ncbi:hypothetical protein RFI_03387 [Reticulomyxa filosa]|uniref:Uncharacterized protein n=1 Tax=Reticulomyxa filosa TaxID=46433 RepID=X6P591_RETFI|nr:hypothetical protein RFI_03387 [Reticulomyxa filosa]|eukprot:ETO33715.1 hypothetical protein RFI_03387 [Reticulomyxa filosa]
MINFNTYYTIIINGFDEIEKNNNLKQWLQHYIQNYIRIYFQNIQVDEKNNPSLKLLNHTPLYLRLFCYLAKKKIINIG